MSKVDNSDTEEKVVVYSIIWVYYGILSTDLKKNLGVKKND